MNPENSSNTATHSTTPPSEPPKKDEKTSSFKSIIKEVIIFAVIAFGIVLPFRLYIAEPYIVSGASMDPTFETGDYLIVNKISYRFEKPERNTVVVFRYPGDTSKSFIKRIIGLPGETIVMKDNTVSIINTENPKGFVVDQSYVSHASPGNLEKTLGPDEYFVMGDNRAESFDSRSWGALPKQYILGKPILRLLPLTEIGILPGNDSR